MHIVPTLLALTAVVTATPELVDTLGDLGAEIQRVNTEFAAAAPGLSTSGCKYMEVSA